MSAIPEIAVRLADEGVPLRAIARAIKMSSDLLREGLKRAQSAGMLLDLPRDDWPQGFPRDQRALQLSRMALENRRQLLLTMQQLFHLPPTGTSLLLVLMQHPSLLKARTTDTMTIQSVDVHIHYIRKRLAPHGIEIQTLWGYGYQFSPENRRKIMDLVLGRVTRSTA